MLLTVLSDGPGVVLNSVMFCGLLYGALNVLKSSRALCPRFSVCFSILIISLGEEGAGLCASRRFVCLFCACMFLSFFRFLLMSRVGCGL